MTRLVNTGKVLVSYTDQTGTVFRQDTTKELKAILKVIKGAGYQASINFRNQIVVSL
jgi:hypothetical protein